MKMISQKKIGTPPTKKMRTHPHPPSSTIADQEEVDAALQLIQLSGDSSGDNTTIINNNNKALPSSRPNKNNFDSAAVAEEESFGNTLNNNNGVGGDCNSSTVDGDEDQVSSTTKNNNIIDYDVVADNLGDDDEDEAFRPRKRKFRSISDVYSNAKPLFERRQGKKK